ncbi:hypothetical protein Csa_005257 [Cucumis sativus]|uniref:Uncharacterized protein n=1 Tax=Cucumis sativus TaxID=3659 RepID=A0A0A0KAB5_CUCSA|nr:hypothetical protein Csa_005257 [Cucumis sativus]
MGEMNRGKFGSVFALLTDRLKSSLFQHRPRGSIRIHFPPQHWTFFDSSHSDTATSTSEKLSASASHLLTSALTASTSEK